MFGDHLENLQGVIISLSDGNYGFYVVGVFRLNRMGDIELCLLGLRIAHACRGVCHCNHRTAHAFTKLVFNNLVGLVLGAFHLRAFCRGKTHAHLTHGNSDSTQCRHTEQNGHHRFSEHDAQPTVRGSLTFFLLGVMRGDLLGSIDRCPRFLRHDPAADQREHSGGQGYRNQHGHEDAQCRRIAHVSQEGNTCHVQGKQGDNHGCSGEENRVTAGAVSDRDRFSQRHAVHQVRPVPVENEQ